MPFRSWFAGSRIPGYLAGLAAGISVGLIAASLIASPAISSGGKLHSSAPPGSATPRVRTQAARTSWVATWAASPMAAADDRQGQRGDRA